MKIKITKIGNMQAALLQKKLPSAVQQILDFTTSEPADPAINVNYLNTKAGVSSITKTEVARGVNFHNGVSWSPIYDDDKAVENTQKRIDRTGLLNLEKEERDTVKQVIRDIVYDFTLTEPPSPIRNKQYFNTGNGVSASSRIDMTPGFYIWKGEWRRVVTNMEAEDDLFTLKMPIFEIERNSSFHYNEETDTFEPCDCAVKTTEMKVGDVLRVATGDDAVEQIKRGEADIIDIYANTWLEPEQNGFISPITAELVRE